MHSKRAFVSALSLSLSLLAVGCGHTQAQDEPRQPDAETMQAIRAYGQVANPQPAARSSAEPQQSAAPSELVEEAAYETWIRLYFHERNFEELEKAGHEARTGKGRVVGGVWKVLDFYDALGEKAVVGDGSDTNWTAYLETFKAWMAAKPESATARVALANAYIQYAWHARGHGYSDSVTREDWNLFEERIESARTTLLQAVRLREKCPYWFEAMQFVALAQGWDKVPTRELLDRASAFEPAYYHYYREYANFLLPKWYGDEGEVEAFADELLKQPDTPDNAVTYFEVASLIVCPCTSNSNRTDLGGLSWPEIKKGYATLDQNYGISNLKRNRFAYMATLAKDKSAAQEAFAQIGANRDTSVWASNEFFERVKSWANSE